MGIPKKPIIFQEVNFQARKNKKILPKKISYISGNRNPEKIPYIFSKESFSCIFPREGFSYISKNRTLHFLAQALKTKNSTSGKFIMLQETKTLKKCYI